jgi:CubicO group peptidase (beta-lactamase class C family)
MSRAASSSLEKTFKSRIADIPDGVTPGFVLQAYHKGKKKLDVEWGKTWKYYDLASLTKILFTVTWVMKGVDVGLVDLDRPLKEYLPWAPQPAPVRDVLAHVAGNEWWQPFYKNISADADVEYRKNQLCEMLRRAIPKKNPEKSLYSDLDFFFLGFLLENVLEQSWSRLWDAFNVEALDDAEVFFHPGNQPRFAKNLYAPTEKLSWRGEALQGVVHDENARALGGVAPHAGLFGSADAVSRWGLWLRAAHGGQDKWLSRSVVRHFATRAMPPERGDWGLGFMLPTAGAASCGDYFSPSSIGHTGFTGTSFWFDPQKDVFVVLLSNRVHPTRKNEEFRKWRPRIHNWVMETLELT